MQLIGDTEIRLVEHETAERDVAAGWLVVRRLKGRRFATVTPARTAAVELNLLGCLNILITGTIREPQ